jgi:GT2 family glycosyltransferase
MTLKETKYPKVAIVILNWNNWQDTLECLDSVAKITYP